MQALPVSATSWRSAEADKASVIVDAEDYFRYARAAMLKARHRIMLIGWDFDARIELVRNDDAIDPGEAPTAIGDLI
ncbi:MAG: phospholipase, partial [Sphingomonas taxi]